MELNKYYTPEIEEFHIGFEYEVYDLGDDMYNWVWKKQIHEGEELRTYFKEELRKNEIRVKFLDHEDIKSFGWKEKGRKYYYIELPTSYPYYLYAILDFRWGYDDISIDVMRSHEIRIEGEEERIFKGCIKNKSELKKLLKQLKIYE